MQISNLFGAFSALRQWEKVSFSWMKTGLKVSCSGWVRSPRTSCTRKRLTCEQSLCKKALFSGIELIRAMLNHNQILLSIDYYSFYLFAEFVEVLTFERISDASK